MRDDATQADARAIDILDRVKTVFASKGFDGATMQDLARAAGISAGNFYRYFPSKAAIVEAMIEREVDCVRESFASIAAAPDPKSALHAMVRQRIRATNDMEGALWAEVEASASRKPEFARAMDRMEEQVAHGLVTVFARIAGVSEEEAARRYAPHAKVMILLVHGVSLQCGARPDRRSDPEVEALVVRLIERALDEIVVDARDATPRSI